MTTQTITQSIPEPAASSTGVRQARSRFLKGPFAPVRQEVTTFDLPVTGQLPPELNGCYLRNGPNPTSLDDTAYHWFLGAGMVHGVRLRAGKAEWYRNRWIRSLAVAEALGEKWPGGPVHGHDFAPNTHVINHAGRTLATVESGPLPYELAPDLGTVGPCDFSGTLKGGFTAHTKADLRTGELHAITYDPHGENVRHIVIDGANRVSRSTEIIVPDRPMMHDFALTEKYVVLYDLPVTFSREAANAGRALPYTWNPAHQARVGLLRRDRSSTVVCWFDIDPCFVFHTLNAYDQGELVVVDVCRYEGAYDVSIMTGRGPVTLDRWVIDPKAGKVTLLRLDDHFQEFPRVDERVVGRRHRYGYTTAIGELRKAIISLPGDLNEDALGEHSAFHPFARGNVLLKHDIAVGTVEAHNFGAGAAAGEAVFAPVSPDAAEDDGYVIAFVHDLERDATDLVILAAQDFTSQPVARIHLPVRVPLGFHGSWLTEPRR